MNSGRKMRGNMLASEAPRGDLGFGSSRPFSDLLHTLLRHADEVETSPLRRRHFNESRKERQTHLPRLGYEQE
jgi:hypothetical protein